MSEQPNVHIQKIYLKDTSFESPNSPKAFTGNEWNPEINLQVNTESNHLEENHFDVALTLTVTAQQGEDTLYLVEVKQAGVFSLSGFEEDQIPAVLGTFCPNTLFPYAREAISSLVERGGFPQLVLQPINFDALYQQHLDSIQESAQVDSGTKH